MNLPMDDAPHPPHDDESESVPRARDARPPVQHCPFCGESVGSFWGRRGDDGSHWCESCQLFFRVETS
jgi:hypothetical protein